MDQLERGRGEIAGVARVERSPVRRLVHDVDSRAELIFFLHEADPVETRTVIDRKRIEDLPFILEVDASLISRLPSVILDRERLVRQGISHIVATWKDVGV